MRTLVAFLLVVIVHGFRLAQLPLSRTNHLMMSVGKKEEYTVTLLPGDGIGPEILASTVPVLETVAAKNGFRFKFREADIGGIAIDNHNDPFPDSTFQSCISSDSVLLACIGGYKWDNNPRHLRPESGLLKMRQSMGLFANLRPAKVIPQLIDASTLKREVIEGVDIMVVRELTGGIYFGTPKGIETVDGVRRGFSTAVYTEPEIERITRVAMGVAQKRKSKVIITYIFLFVDKSSLWKVIFVRCCRQLFIVVYEGVFSGQSKCLGGVSIMERSSDSCGCRISFN